MQVLSSLRDNLSQKLDAVTGTERRLGAAPKDAVEYLRHHLKNRDFVLFCGAGISVSPPSSAPTFLELRTSVVLAIADLLVEKRLVMPDDATSVETTLQRLDTRADLSLPPELAFRRIGDAVGFNEMCRLLTSCLDRGKPNANHGAIRSLISSAGPSLSGLITPNFDLYIEKALEGIPVRRTIVDRMPTVDGFGLFKPHGSLDDLDSIAITIDRIARPLKRSARKLFEEMTAGHTIVVVGYSGWDYDLLPLLANAGGKGAEVLWLLYDHASMNERAAAVQLALGNRCTIVDGQRQSLLPVLTGVVEPVGGRANDDLRLSFANILGAASDDSLIAAIIDLLVPAGLSESEGIVQHLCDGLIKLAESGQIKDDAVLLKRMGNVVSWAAGDSKLRAARLAAECASRLGNETAARGYARTMNGEDDDPASTDLRLQRLDRELREFPYSFESEPDPELAAQMTRAELRIEKAWLLLELGRYSEAAVLAEEVLHDTRFPESGVSENARISADAYTESELHSILGHVAARAGNTSEMQAKFCTTIDILWRELQFWELGTELQEMAQALSQWDRECAEIATELSVSVARLGMDELSELVALEWKADFGFGNAADLDRAEHLLERMQLGSEEREEHLEILHRLRRRHSRRG